MKVAHITISASGGAGIAAGRSVAALREVGIEAELWTADPPDEGGRRVRSPRWSGWRGRIDRWPLWRYPRRCFFSEWSNSVLPSRIARTVKRSAPDLVHLHWLGGGFVRVEELKRFPMPIVWTLHDTWPLTGGCHYPDDCRRFAAGCGSCPQLSSTIGDDLSARNFSRKRRAFAGVSRWIAPSIWIRDLARQSPLAAGSQVEIVPNGLDGTVFRPGDRASARRRLELPENAVVFAAGAVDLRERRKGAHFLPEAVRLAQHRLGRPCILVVFGRGVAGSAESRLNTRALGPIEDPAKLAAVYRAADLLLLPSTQDNLPNIAVEALACGCPTVAFDSGGIRDIVRDDVTGELVSEQSAASLAEAAVRWITRGRPAEMVAVECRSHFETNFSYAVHARRLRLVYETVLDTTGEQPPLPSCS